MGARLGNDVRHHGNGTVAARSTRSFAVMKFALVVVLCLAQAAWAIDGRYRGRYYWGAEVEAFHPCGSSKSYWIIGEDPALEPLRRRTDALREQSENPYPPIYVEAIGAIDTRSKRDGFAEGYDGLFHLRRVVRISSTAPKDCYQGP